MTPTDKSLFDDLLRVVDKVIGRDASVNPSEEPLCALRNAGLAVALARDGTLVVRGDRRTLERWRSFLRERKTTVQAALLAEHAQNLTHALALALPREKAEHEAKAATGLLARNTRCPWAALRLALQDESLPDTPDPVDRPPYGLPAWCLSPKTGKPIRQGRFNPTVKES